MTAAMRMRVVIGLVSLAAPAGCGVPPEVAPPPVDIRLDLQEPLAYVADSKLATADGPIVPSELGYEQPPAGGGLRRHMSPEQVERLLGKPSYVWGGEDATPMDTYLHYYVYEEWGLELTFHSHRGLGALYIRDRWTEPVVGVRVGDDWEAFLKQHNLVAPSPDDTAESGEVGISVPEGSGAGPPPSQRVYRDGQELPDDPGWRVEGERFGRVTGIRYIDEGIIGQWEVEYFY
jgi:hypothetical protein